MIADLLASLALGVATYLMFDLVEASRLYRRARPWPAR